LTELIPGVRKSSKVIRGKSDLTKRQAHGESVSVLSPGSVFETDLPIMTIGYPHRITIRCPRNQSNGLQLELGQPADRNPAQFSASVHQGDSLLDLQTGQNAPSQDPWIERTFQYYPQSGDQLTLINQNSDNDVAFDSIQVTAGPSTSQSLNARRRPGLGNFDTARLREVVMMVRDTNWADAITQDWQMDTDADPISPNCVRLHRVWLATHRLIEQAQSMGANCVAVPWDAQPQTSSDDPSAQLTEPLGKDISTLSDRQRVELHVFERFNTDFKANLAITMDSPDRLARLTDDLSRFECFDGYILSLATPPRQPDVTSAQDLLKSLVRSTGGKSLIIQANTPESFQLIADAAAFCTGVTLVTPNKPWHDRATKQPLVAQETKTAVTKAAITKAAITKAAVPKPAGAPTERTLAIGTLIGKQSLHPQQPADAIQSHIDRHHPSVLMVDRALVSGLVDDDLLRICKAFQALSIDAEAIMPMDSTSVVGRAEHSVVDGRAVLAVSNLAPWPVKFSLRITGKSDRSNRRAAELYDEVIWERIDDGSMARSRAADLEQGLALAPRDTMMLRTRFPVPDGWKVVPANWRWQSSMIGGEPITTQIKQHVTTIVERMGMLSDPGAFGSLKNGSFEQVGQMGLVGWLHAQHPPGCVAVDSTQSTEGSKSIRLVTEESVSARTWLVSETVPVPMTRRLAVSMALRGAVLAKEDGSPADARVMNRNPNNQANPNPSHRLRISLEGIQAGHPIRKSAEIAVPASANWQPRRMVLEADGLDASTMQTLRLTIDSLTAGTVWIDDVRLHDDFSTTRERTDLQNLAFLAVEGLKRGNLSPSAKLLVNPWAQRLLDKTPAPSPPRSKDSPVSWNADVAEEAAAEVAEKNRGWLLDRLRF
jgi:hypothetical protein